MTTTDQDMLQLRAPVDDLNQAVRSGTFMAPRLDFEVLKFLGVFLLKSAISPAATQRYADIYFESIRTDKLKKTEFHLTEVKVHEAHALQLIAHEPDFVKIASMFFNGRVGSDFIRIVKKDADNHLPVFTHQDSCYQIGGLERYSLFIALTDCNAANGGLALYPGTHHFGYLGDAGEIEDILPSGYPKVAPDMAPGDILVMHSATWHQSSENTSRTDRVYLEVHIQDIDEPTTKISICGERRSPWSLPLSEDEIFKNSRTQRIRKLFKEIEQLKADEALKSDI